MIQNLVARARFEVSLHEASQAQLRLDDVQFEPRSLQPRASPVRIARVVVGNSALRRIYPVSCALQVRNGILPRLGPRAFPAPSFRRAPGEDGCLELLRGRHWATPISRERTAAIKHIQRSFAKRVAVFSGPHGLGPTTACHRLQAE